MYGFAIASLMKVHSRCCVALRSPSPPPLVGNCSVYCPSWRWHPSVRGSFPSYVWPLLRRLSFLALTPHFVKPDYMYGIFVTCVPRASHSLSLRARCWCLGLKISRWMLCADMFYCHRRYVHCGFTASVINDFFFHHSIHPTCPSWRLGLERMLWRKRATSNKTIGETFVFKEVRTIPSHIHLELVWAFSRAGGSKAG